VHPRKGEKAFEQRSGEAAALAMKRGKSVDFTSYWQGHVTATH
jgi:hypothetical protein